MLRKNVAGQFVHIAGVNVSTGTIVTGATWTMRRCLDGTFAAGGATITEDGTTGFYKVALAQADTNGNDIGYFFTATNCVPVTINALTTAADPSDTVRLGLTALPNAAAEAAGGLYTRGTGAGQIAQDANGNVRVNIDTIKTQTVTLSGGVTIPAATLASTTNITAATGVTLTATTGLGNQTANITGNLSGSVGSVTGAVGSVAAGGIAAASFAAGAVDAAALATDAVNEIADGVLDRNMATGADSGSTTVRTMRQALRFLRNKWSISGTTLTVTKEDDTTASWTATVTTDVAADPITASDPAGP